VEEEVKSGRSFKRGDAGDAEGVGLACALEEMNRKISDPQMTQIFADWVAGRGSEWKTCWEGSISDGIQLPALRVLRNSAFPFLGPIYEGFTNSRIYQQDTHLFVVNKFMMEVHALVSIASTAIVMHPVPDSIVPPLLDCDQIQ
jgi:hypothetical protein